MKPLSAEKKEQLSEYAQNLAYDIAFWYSGVQDKQYPLAELGKVSAETSEKLHTLALLVLTVKGEREKFAANLSRSAECRAIFLERMSRKPSLRDRYSASGFIEPFFDAVVARDAVNAQKIATFSSEEFMEGSETEEAFRSARLLFALTGSPRDKKGSKKCMADFEAVAGKKNAVRVAVLREIVRKDQGEFEAAFERLLDARVRSLRTLARSSDLDEEQLYVEKQIYIEGLALLQIAGQWGIVTDREYRFCPR